MKKLLHFFLGSVAACILFSSCSSVSVVKRHHRNGYYVNIENGKQSRPVAEQKTSDTEPVSKVNDVPEKMTESIVAENHPVTEVPAEVQKKQAKKAFRSEPVKHSPEPKSQVIEHAKQLVISPVKTLSELQRNSDNRSVFWTIIIILLVLWLVGYLLGYHFGGLIWTLLVIVLIILLLMLLGVI